MKTIKSTLIAVVAIVLAISASACSSDGVVPSVPESINPSECTHSYVQTTLVPALPLRDGEMLYTCHRCKDSYTELISMTKTLKVLAVGNSFSDDAMEYLWNICHDGGVETIILGNLYFGGCTLERHHKYLMTDTPYYIYRKNTDGEWISTENTSMITGFKDEKWDIITIQQASGLSGIQSSYAQLDDFVIEVTNRNPKADIYWHMTWSYQKDSTHADFPKYDRDQMKMYSAITRAVKSKVLKNENIKGVIPAGTAIQNLRSSYVGDILTRDGYHLSYEHGRYTAALTWYAYLTGGDVDAITWVPEKYESVLTPDLEVIKESVKNAISEPYKVTQSKHK